MSKRQRAAAKRIIVDTGTPERGQHDQIVMERAIEKDDAGRPMGEVIRMRAVAHPIDRYLTRTTITQRQADAAKRLEADYRRAQFDQAVVASYGAATGGHGEMSDIAADARKRYRDAMMAVGIRLCPVLVHVVCMGLAARDWEHAKGLNKDSGIELLRLALDILGDHYGMPIERGGA